MLLVVLIVVCKLIFSIIILPQYLQKITVKALLSLAVHVLNLIGAVM